MTTYDHDMGFLGLRLWNTRSCILTEYTCPCINTFLAQTLALDFIILIPHSNKDPDEVEELRVDSDMEKYKDDYDEAEREEEKMEEPKCWFRTRQ